jgi:hypothetical protein
MSLYLGTDNNNCIIRVIDCNEADIKHYTQDLNWVIAPNNYIHGTHTHFDESRGLASVFNLERALNAIKRERILRLDQCDIVYCNAERWSAMTAEKQADWSAYKQALRDFPETCDVENPVWPVMPV